MADSFDDWDDEETVDLQGDDGFNSIEEVIELNMQYSLLNFLPYGISIASDLDGLYDEIVTIPEIANEQAGGILWVLLTSGFFHRIRLEANAAGEYYHLRYCEATMFYQGQLS